MPRFTVKTGSGEERPSFVGQVAVEGGAQPQDVYGFLFRGVEEVVLDGPRDRSSSIF